jgi:hypothetical protein
MKKVVTFCIGVVIVHFGWNVISAADPDQKEVIVEDRPLRSWLKEMHLGGSPYPCDPHPTIADELSQSS